VAGSWHLGLYVCLAWTGSDVILSTTSIMHLCAIALYRYVGIVYPLRMRSAQEARHVAALVVPAWTIAIALSVPFVVQGTTHSGKLCLNSHCYQTTITRARTDHFLRTMNLRQAVTYLQFPIQICFCSHVRQQVRTAANLISKFTFTFSKKEHYSASDHKV